MKQPEIGVKISEIRKTKRVTQRELAESCNVDIRTIQRIEAGEVDPRISTLKLISEALEINESIFNRSDQTWGKNITSNILLISIIAGIFQLVYTFLNMEILTIHSMLSKGSVFFIMSIIHILSGVVFYYGFYIIGRYRENKLIQIAAITIMIIIPLFVLTDIIAISSPYQFVIYLKKLCVIIMGINAIIFGIGMLKVDGYFQYKIAGILQVLIGPMFIIPLPLIQYIGLWLSLLFIILLLMILVLEYKEVKSPSHENYSV